MNSASIRESVITLCSVVRVVANRVSSASGQSVRNANSVQRSCFSSFKSVRSSDNRCWCLVEARRTNAIEIGSRSATMPGKGKNKKRGASKQAAAQSQNPASDKETPSPDKNESNDPNDVQTGPAAAALQPPKEEKQTESALTEESKEGAVAIEMPPTKEEIKPESSALDGALASGKEPGIEKADVTEGDGLPVLMTSDEPIAKSADKKEKTSTAQPVVDVEVEEDKEHSKVLKQSLGEAVVDQAGLPSGSDATQDDEMMSDNGSKDSQQIADNKDMPNFGSPSTSSEMIMTGQSAVAQEIDSKRSSEDDNKATPFKRFRSAKDIDVRLLMPNRSLSLIIGTGGENLTQLRSLHKVDISIPDNRGSEGILLICGSTEAVSECLLDIIPMSQLTSAVQVSKHEIRVLVPHELVSLILSNGRARFLNLQLQTGCHMKIYVDFAPFSLERVIELTGTVDEIINCSSALHKVVSELPRKQAAVLYNPRNYDMLNAAGYGGYLDEDSSKNKVILSALNSTRRRTTEVFLPHKFIEGLLGSHGSRLKKVQRESEAKIQLDYAREGPTERIMSISGTGPQVQYTSYLLQIALRQQAGTAH